MSLDLMDRSFPPGRRAISDAELARIVAAALRDDFGEKRSLIKHIGRLTGASPRTVKNWCEARNTPSSGHLLLLARSSQTLLRFILGQLGGEDLSDAFFLLNGRRREPDPAARFAKDAEVYSDNSVTINVVINPSVATILNERQLWFLGMIQNGNKPKTEAICDFWAVTMRTAKRDIACLMEKRLVVFTGARKTGSYVLR